MQNHKFKIGDYVSCDCGCGAKGIIDSIRGDTVFISITSPGSLPVQIGEIEVLTLESIYMVSKLEKAMM